VVSFHVTVANYEYLVYWRFYQDGNIECEVRATGIMVTSPFPEGQPPPYGTVVDERTYAPYHQHFIVARLDLDVDGRGQHRLRQRIGDPAGRPDNPYGLGLVVRNTPLRTEAEGSQDYDWATPADLEGRQRQRDERARAPRSGTSWSRAACIPPLMDPASPVLRRAEAIRHTLWVTPYHPDERWPCGEFPNLGDRDTGLALWTERNRSIENTDVVLWYVFGIHHITRPEDWPIMPVDTVSFWLKPVGFFDRNPALDVPP
jgi:primary-amine oxidase